MKAVIWTKYGSPDGLKLQEVEKPTPKDREVLIRIHATTATAGDCEMRMLKFPLLLGLSVRIYTGFRKPKRITILGQELSGEIEAAGSDVRLFKKGDKVFAALGFRMGAYAEYICLPEEPGDMEGVLAVMPSNITYEEAAAVPVGGLNALHFLRRGNVQRGQKVLINGAGGSIGTIAIQLAKHYGAEVTGVDSASKLDMLRSIGADHVFDYAREDFAESGNTYDVILDVVGKSPLSRSIRSLSKHGCYLMAYPGLSRMLRRPWISMRSGKRIIGGSAPYDLEGLNHLRELIEAGEVRSVIDRCYPLERIGEAHAYVESGRKKGNVVITQEG